ncbi:MAG: DUF402 domain-containing protein [Corynebacterium sp.]|nr:DUF402 domain-containing protein [Corynebacterium sp.]
MELHPIKTETFDIDAMINIDPKSFRREVDHFMRTDFGLYMARGANHPRFGYLESWLLPEVNLRVNKFHNRPEFPATEMYYIDIATVRMGESQWHTQDLYVDLMNDPGDPVRFTDIDELSAATSAGLISPGLAETAIAATLKAVEGITRHGDDITQWLAALGMPLHWASSVELIPATD